MMRRRIFPADDWFIQIRSAQEWSFYCHLTFDSSTVNCIYFKYPSKLTIHLSLAHDTLRPKVWRFNLPFFSLIVLCPIFSSKWFASTPTRENLDYTIRLNVEIKSLSSSYSSSSSEHLDRSWDCVTGFGRARGWWEGVSRVFCRFIPPPPPSSSWNHSHKYGVINWSMEINQPDAE